MLEKGLSKKSKNTEARKKYVNYESFVLPRRRLCQKKVLQTSKPLTEARKACKLRAFWRFQGRASAWNRLFTQVFFNGGPKKHVNYEPFGLPKPRQCQKRAFQGSKPFTEARKARKLRACWRFQGRASAWNRLFTQIFFNTRCWKPRTLRAFFRLVRFWGLPTAPSPEHPNTQMHIQTYQVLKVRKHMIKADFK